MSRIVKLDSIHLTPCQCTSSICFIKRIEVKELDVIIREGYEGEHLI